MKTAPGSDIEFAKSILTSCNSILEDARAEADGEVGLDKESEEDEEDEETEPEINDKEVVWNPDWSDEKKAAAEANWGKWSSLETGDKTE